MAPYDLVLMILWWCGEKERKIDRVRGCATEPECVYASATGATPGSDKASRGFEPRSLDSGSRVLTVTPRSHRETAMSEVNPK